MSNIKLDNDYLKQIEQEIDKLKSQCEKNEIDNSDNMLFDNFISESDDSLSEEDCFDEDDVVSTSKTQRDSDVVLFEDLNLRPEVLKAIKDLGYETPSPIQEKSIAPLLEGRDIIGQAQTGTGKTAAFSLPLLSTVDIKAKDIQILILTPTRELAIQVAEAVQSFAKYLPKFNVLPIYGGASYDTQIKALNRGVQLVVGTPGRIMDLIERGKLKLEGLKALVLDEADEMLKMGFIDDVEWIMDRCPENRQIALFSATMPDAIKRVATKYLNNPTEIKIASKTTTATTVRQRYWLVSGLHKIDALTRLLDVEPYDALLIFTRTKTEAEDLASKLTARGHACEALHGDIPQKIREKIVDKLRNGQLDILIATDVVARGLDVERITHVVNYDIPYDPESYVHRIGRTGRAGRTGDAILFVSPKERRMLRLIEHTTKQPIEPMKMPTTQDINRHRLLAFKNKILGALEDDNLEPFAQLINEILADDAIEPIDLCTALAKLVQGGEPLFIDESQPEPKQKSFDELGGRDRGERRGDRKKMPTSKAEPLKDFPEIPMLRYRVAVGYKDGVKPGQIVGAIANEGNIESKYIGNIDIFETFATIDLPDGMPNEVLQVLKQARVCGRALEIRKYYADKDEGGNSSRSGNSRFKDRDFHRSERNHKIFDTKTEKRSSRNSKKDEKSSRRNRRSK
jgi:ATP-dependent RNA helicase DeaD